MNASTDSTAPRGLIGWWLSPPRTGMRRAIAPWEYRHLRVFAGIRIAVGFVVIGLAGVTLALGGNDGTAYACAAAFLALAAAQWLVAYWLLTIARSEPART